MTVRDRQAALVVADEPGLRARTTDELSRAGGWYVFACSTDDIPSVLRSVRIDVLIVVGEDAAASFAQMPAAFSQLARQSFRVVMAGDAAAARAAVSRST